MFLTFGELGERDMQSTACIEPLSTVQRHFLFSPSSSFPWGQFLLKARMLGSSCEQPTSEQQCSDYFFCD